MPAAPRRRLAALLLGPLMVIGLLLGLASPAGAQTFPQPVGIGATPDEIRTINLYFRFGVATDNIEFPIATGGIAPLTYSVTGNPGLESLGFSFDPKTRIFKGTPTLAGAGQAGDGFAFTYRARSSAGGGFALIFVKVTVCEGSGSTDGETVCTPPDFAALGFAAALAGQSYTVGTPITALTLPVATGGTGSSPTFIYRLTSSGGLPDGLSFDAATRRLTGTPTTAKQSTLTYRVQDAASLKEFNRQFPLDVNAAAVDADTTPPTVTLDTIAEGVIGTAQDYDITFSEAVTGLAVDDFSVSTNIVASGDLMVNNVTPASGPSTTYTISITPRATAFTLTLAADSVMDTATTPNMGPATAASVSGSATAPELPLITGPATLEISENTSNDTLLGTYTTTADVRIFALITNVLDVDLFRIRPNGELRFDNSPVFSPDYEAPQDQGADNVYNLTIRGLKIVDGDFQTLVQDLDIVVTIINVDEPGAISAITGDVEVGQTLTAGTVTDEDSPVSGTPVSSITHQWQSAVDGTAADAAVDDAAWPDISSATGAIYDPGVGDVGRIIRVVATYTDGEGGGKKVASAATGAVAAAATTAPTSDTSLATLTLTGSDGSEITLTPAFMAGVSVDSPYTASVANGVTSVTIAASSTHATTNIVVVVNGAQVTGDKSPSPVTDTGNLTEVGSTPNTIEIEVTAEDGNSFESYNIHITRAGPPPGIALRRDTAADGGVNTDRLTRNRDIDVTLATGFNTNSDTWEYSTDGGVTAFVPGTGTGFTLPAVSADYAADQVRVRQTVDGIRSDFAGLDAFTIDADAPTANLGSITGAVIDQAGQTHAITFSEAVAGLAAGDFSASTGITVTAVSGSDGGTDYTITYTATAASFNLILTAGSVTDLAAWPVARTSITGTATAPLPVITGPVTLSIPENTAAGTRLGTYTTTADVDNFAVFTSVLDGGLFRIESNGELRFENLPSFSPDYEAPRDVGADNVYNLTIVGVRSRGVEALTQDLNIAVTVTNVDEPGAISAITGDAQVGEMLAAGTVTDEDSPPAGTPVSGITHQWQSAAEGTAADAAVDDSAWPDISSATGATYEPVVGDVGRIIRVVATYTDGEGGGKKVASAATGAVAAAALSTDSTLSALDVSAGTLNPAFNAATDAYAVSVGTGATSVTVTPTTTDDGATVVVNGVAVASGQPSEAIDLNVGNNTIPIVVTAEDTSTQTYTVTVARAVPQPGIALASDTARDGGINTDRITRNRSIVVTLHADFQNDRDTWEWSSNSGNSHTTGSNTDRSFDLDVAQATYNDNVVRARQTVNGVVSEFAGLAMFQHDTVKPTISLNGGGASVTITKGDAYNDPVTADDALDGPIDPSNIVITGGPVDVDTAGEYTLTYNVMDRAGNAADPLTRTVTVSEPTATTPEPPVLSAGTITNTSVVLEWTAVDNAASYTLTRVVAGGANVVVFSGNALTATDTGLTAETPYKYVVTVTVGGRTSADSNEVDATTLVAPVTTPAPTVTVERLSDNSIEVSWDNIDGVDFTIYAIKTGEADAVIIALVTSPHTIATTDPLFDTVNNADAIGVRGFAEGNPVGDHSAQITSDEVPPVDITAPPVPVITTSPATVGSTPITIDGTAEAGTTVELFNGVTSAGTVTAADGTGAFSFAVTLTEGTNTFTATASDGPNTSDASSPVVITLDTETPEAPIITTSPATVNSPSIMIVGTAEAGTTVELLNGVTSAGTVTAADGTGAFSFTVTLTEGTNTFTATASDGPNTSAASPAVVITLDTETPEAPIITTSPATVNSPSIMIVGTAEAGTTVELFNGVTSAGTVTADSGSFSFTGVALNPGANSFTATASDGPNKSAESSAVTITLDTETPEAPEITTPSETVNSPSITIAGTAEAGTTVELFNGVTSAGTVTAADGTGAFSFTVTLTEGANTFTATASDGVNTSAASPPVLITLDTETPEAPIITTQTATVNSPSITITGTAEAGTTVELLKGGTSTGDTVTAAAGTGTFSFTVTLTEGTNTFTATASDGPNTSASSSPVLITLDTETPEVPAITTSPATVNSPSITITGTAEAGTTVDLLKEGTSSVGTTTADGTGNFSFAVTLTEGTNTFTATASDGTNKSAASPAVVITLDTIAPAVPAITTSPATVGSTPITIVGTAEAGTTVELFNGVTSAGTVTADSGSFSFTGVALNPGANSFTATASDGVNTSASSPAVVITLDTETPEVPAITTSPATVGSTPITIDGTAEAGATVELFNGVTSAGTVTADSGSFSFTGVALNPGANSFTATASDGVNTSAASSPVVITLDTETPAPPAITTSPATVNTPSITIVGTAEAGTTVELFNGVTSAGTVTADSGSFSFTVTLTEGTNTFTATASDGVNKSAASPAVVITLDTVAPAPPTITTSPATVDTASFTIEGIAEAGTTVNLLKGGASVDTTTADSGNFSFAVTLTEGTNTFTATASDGTNKSAASPTVVITLDTIAPAVPAITTSPATVGSTPITIVGTAEAGTTVDLLKEGTSSVGTTTADGDGNFSFAGVALTEGANSFTATASDGPNTSAASSPVVITLDTETPPVPAITTSPATVGSTPITIDGTAEAGTTVELFNGVTSAGTVTADSGSFSFTGVALNPGANSFTATASDGPNTSAASPPVVITLDTTAPAIEVILSEVARVIADQNISAIAGRVERARTQQNGASSFNFAGQQMSFNGNGGRNDNGDQAMSSTVANLMNTHASSMEDGTLDMKTLLGNSEFTMPLNFVGGEDSSGITFWGSGDYRNFGGEDDDQELDWDGDMFSVHFGLDGRTAEAIGGVALSWNEGELETDDKTTYDISLTSINPYFGWGGARGEVWMTAGYGSGELKRDNGASNDLSMSTFAIGGNGIVRQRGASTLRLKGEVSQSTLEVDANKDNSGLEASEVDTNRVRVSLESTNTIALDNGARTERSAEAGIRHDGGDGATGSGAELGFGISHVNANGFSVEGKARVLLGHDGDANEWGVSGAIKKTAGADGQGWSFALSPGYGDDAGDIQRLWDEGLRDADGNATATDTDTAADATRDYAARLDLRVGYGMNGFTGPSWLGSGRGLLTPYTAMTLSNDNNRYRLGIQWKLGNRLDLGLVGEHRDADDDDDAILLKGELRF